MTMTEADIAEIADSWTQEDLAEWSSRGRDWQFRLLSGEYEYKGPGDDPFDLTNLK